MTREEAISWLVSLAEHEGEDIPIYDDDIKAISISINTMRKYQKIEKIVKVWHQDIYAKDFECIAEIAEVVEDGNDTNS